MPKSFTKLFQVTLLLWSVLNTGIVMMGFQVFAWMQMTHDLSKEVSFREAVQIVASGEEACEICKFVSENNPIEKSQDPAILLFDFPLLYVSTVHSGFVDSLVGCPLPRMHGCSNLASVITEVEPPPPKALL